MPRTQQGTTFEQGIISNATQQLAQTAQYRDTCILLDTGSTFSCVNNKDMLVDIKKEKRMLRGFTNAESGHRDYTHTQATCQDGTEYGITLRLSLTS